MKVPEISKSTIFVDAEGVVHKFKFKDYDRAAAEITIAGLEKHGAKAKVAVHSGKVTFTVVKVKREFFDVAAPAPQRLDPPEFAEFLLTLLATTRTAEAMIGDLNEHFARERKELGRDRAVRLYCARTLRSLWPLLRRAIGKAMKWGAVIAAVRRLF
jgi:hypothetical protein